MTMEGPRKPSLQSDSPQGEFFFNSTNREPDNLQKVPPPPEPEAISDDEQRNAQPRKPVIDLEKGDVVVHDGTTKIVEFKRTEPDGGVFLQFAKNMGIARLDRDQELPLGGSNI